jgi:CRISPR-associated protein (TIGR03986 family)
VFHPPYHFIPFDRQAAETDIQRKDFDDRQPERATHDRYVTDTLSGRIVCRATTESPIFVGAKRREGSPATVDGFEIGAQPALPGSSLRGLVSSLAEAASNSAMRVLENRTYSYRRKMDPKETLSAIGMIIGDGPSYKLMPLCLPTMEADRNGIATLPREYRSQFPDPLLKVYIGNAQSIRDDRTFHHRTTTVADWRLYYMALSWRQWEPGGQFRLAVDDYSHAVPPHLRRYVVSQKPLAGASLVPTATKDEIPESVRGFATVGLIRVLGCFPPREQTIPKGKKHELFLPYPIRKDWPRVPILPSAVERFHELCDERSEATWKKDSVLPFEPLNTRPGRDRARSAKDAAIRLKHGDLVYFRPDKDGENIAEISFSAIWRGRVEDNAGNAAKAFAFFPARLWPYGEEKQKQRGADVLTPADLLFGFVEERKKSEEKGQEAEQSLALASRVRFSDATLLPEQAKPYREDEVLLRVLDGPKPPCPSFYFKTRAGAPERIEKARLAPADHEAQGRKMYLLHRRQEIDAKPWKTDRPDDNLDQKSRIRPLRAGLAFEFELNFSNLSREELSLLLYALRPTDAFRHKLGMGKPLGLGTIRIDPEKLELIDRKTRYSTEGLFAPRYSGPSDWKAYRNEFANSMSRTIRQALEALGDPAQLAAPVQSPLVDTQYNPEEETFRWFMEVNQQLPPIRNGRLPVLNRRG